MIQPVAVIVVLVTANVLNNRLASDAYVITGVGATVLLIVLARWDGCSWDDLGLGRGTWRSGLRWGGAAAGLVLLAYAAGAVLPLTQDAFADDRAAELSGGEVLWNAFGRVPLGTVLLEEIAFRGVLYAVLESRWGTRNAIIGSSALFGLWHVLPSTGLAGRNAAVGGIVGDGPLATTLAVSGVVVGTALAGVVFCELRRRSGSLLAPMGLHWALNGLGVAFAWALNGGGR
ncbi:CPBP family intramembrane glutamic endopeptidase [Spirillospora sp. NPDC047279]|uniref:CPBP family intramembrane glutamic endopeptidase n=1 Tax=Spirillospora sp. NPDC047279 TaxID=3155478 RepID=UPI003403AC0F